MEAWIKLDAYPSGIAGSGIVLMGHTSTLGIGLQVYGTTTSAYINFGYTTNSNYDSGNITGKRMASHSRYKQLWEAL